MPLTRSFLARYQSINRSPGVVFRVLAWGWDLKERIPKLSTGKLEATRFYRANRLSAEDFNSIVQSALSIDLAFVCAGKDFDTLTKSIEAGIKSTSNFELKKIIVIVPEKDLKNAGDLLAKFGNQVDLRSEDELVSGSDRTRLRQKFGNRYGWALQQLLKVSAVITASSQGVLIIDADTLLLTKRKWFDKDGAQTLTPSWEDNFSYYDFLSSVKISDPVPEYTFISHHMLIQPKFMREAMKFAGWNNLSAIVDSLVKWNFKNPRSPFCIEYELYGQYMWNHHRDKVRLEKWGNIGLPRSAFKEFGNPQGYSIGDFKDYASLSLHSYL